MCVCDFVTLRDSTRLDETQMIDQTKKHMDTYRVRFPLQQLDAEPLAARLEVAVLLRPAVGLFGYKDHTGCYVDRTGCHRLLLCYHTRLARVAAAPGGVRWVTGTGHSLHTGGINWCFEWPRYVSM